MNWDLNVVYSSSPSQFVLHINGLLSPPSSCTIEMVKNNDYGLTIDVDPSEFEGDSSTGYTYKRFILPNTEVLRFYALVWGDPSYATDNDMFTDSDQISFRVTIDGETQTSQTFNAWNGYTPPMYLGVPDAGDILNIPYSIYPRSSDFYTCKIELIKVPNTVLSTYTKAIAVTEDSGLITGTFNVDTTKLSPGTSYRVSMGITDAICQYEFTTEGTASDILDKLENVTLSTKDGSFPGHTLHPTIYTPFEVSFDNDYPDGVKYKLQVELLLNTETINQFTKSYDSLPLIFNASEELSIDGEPNLDGIRIRLKASNSSYTQESAWVYEELLEPYPDVLEQQMTLSDITNTSVTIQSPPFKPRGSNPIDLQLVYTSTSTNDEFLRFSIDNVINTNMNNTPAGLLQMLPNNVYKTQEIDSILEFHRLYVITLELFRYGQGEYRLSESTVLTQYPTPEITNAELSDNEVVITFTDPDIQNVCNLSDPLWDFFGKDNIITLRLYQAHTEISSKTIPYTGQTTASIELPSDVDRTMYLQASIQISNPTFESNGFFSEEVESADISLTQSDANKPSNVTVTSGNTTPSYYSTFELEFTTESGNYGTYNIIIQGTNKDGSKISKEIITSTSPVEIYLPSYFTSSELSKLDSFTIGVQSVLDDGVGELVSSTSTKLSSPKCTIKSLTTEIVNNKIMVIPDVETDYPDLTYKLIATGVQLDVDNVPNITLTGDYTPNIELTGALYYCLYDIKLELYNDSTLLTTSNTVRSKRLEFDLSNWLKQPIRYTSDTDSVCPSSTLTVNYALFDISKYQGCSVVSYKVIKKYASSGAGNSSTNGSLILGISEYDVQQGGFNLQLTVEVKVGDNSKVTLPLSNPPTLPVTATPFAKPNVNVFVSSITKNSIALQLVSDSREHNSKTNMSYNLQLLKGSTKVKDVTNHTTDTYTFSNLDPATEYTIKVSATIGLKSSSSSNVTSDQITTKATTIDPNIKEFRLRIIK